MSQIAQALAKAKERTGHTSAPFMMSGAVPAAPFSAAVPSSSPAPARVRKVRDTSRFWLFLSCAALPLTGGVIWWQLHETSVIAAPASAPIVQSASAAIVAPTAANFSTSAPAAVAKALPGPKSAAAAQAQPVLRPEHVRAVAALQISAVMPGDPARIMLAGKLVRAGTVLDNGLTFAGVADGQLRFTDAQGAVYTRHY